MTLPKSLFLIVLVLLMAQDAFSENTFKAIVVDEKTTETLPGATAYINSLNKGAAADVNGKLEIKNIPDGAFTIVFTCIGYKAFRLNVSLPATNPGDVTTVRLEPSVLETEGILVTTTRTGNRIEDVPVRVEVLGSQEVNEETAIKPGNIAKLLGETSGIQIQQTSATSGNVSFRIQGLPGQYTQLLKDGFPLYSGLSAGLSLLQIPPLDLQQVEVIKGSSSTLYGGGAIAGIVNLVSKEPTDETEWTAILNQTHKGGTDISSFYSSRDGKLGITFVASQSTQKAWDVNGDGFTDLPEIRQTTVSPKLLYYFNDSTTLMLGVSSFFEDRVGGDIHAIENAPDTMHTYIEKGRSSRVTSQLKFEKQMGTGSALTFKNSVNRFHRNMSSTTASFGGVQTSTYTELSYLLRTNHHDLVTGLNFITDSFNEDKVFPRVPLDYRHSTAGMFVQDDWKLATKVILQPGVRTDYQNKYGVFILPRFSALYKVSDRLYARITGGFGYNTPTVFTDKAEEDNYRNMLPIGDNIKAETSHGANVDVNYKGILFRKFVFAVNQALYFTRLSNPIAPQADSLARGVLYYENASGPLEAKGFDTNVSLALDELALFVDYTFTEAQEKHDNTDSQLELTPKHKLNITLTYEQEQSWRTGIEAFYTGSQYRSDRTRTPDYWTMGFMIEKVFRHFSIIGNVENIFDTRQTRFEDVVIPPYTNPTFREIYAPLDGIVANVALQIRL
jgi:outer membrane receptor for ferrienterochelin and colicins